MVTWCPSFSCHCACKRVNSSPLPIPSFVSQGVLTVLCFFIRYRHRECRLLLSWLLPFYHLSLVPVSISLLLPDFFSCFDQLTVSDVCWSFMNKHQAAFLQLNWVHLCLLGLEYRNWLGVCWVQTKHKLPSVIFQQILILIISGTRGLV